MAIRGPRVDLALPRPLGVRRHRRGVGAGVELVRDLEGIDMNKILIDRAVVEQALEALEDMLGWQSLAPQTIQESAKGRAAALRAALAEPQRRKTGKPRNATTRLGVVCFEAYARSYVGSNRWDIAAEAVRRAALAEQVQQGCDHCNHPLYAAVKCRVCGRVTEPVQEPVAYSVGRTLHWHEGKGVNDAQLYTAPPQRKPPATIDEMFDRMNKAPRGVFAGHDPITIWMEAWRAAEQHHKIGGEA